MTEVKDLTNHKFSYSTEQLIELKELRLKAENLDTMAPAVTDVDDECVVS